MEAKETFKVLITGATKTYWYKGKIGEVFEVKEADMDDYLAIQPNNFISKSDCHVIEPTWKVMKDAEETGRDVQVWIASAKKWASPTCWYIGDIYRLTPEPVQPEYEPHSYEDADKLRGLWIKRKGLDGQEMITAIHQYRIGTSERQCPSYSELFEKYETLDGQPVGKLK